MIKLHLHRPTRTRAVDRYLLLSPVYQSFLIIYLFTRVVMGGVLIPFRRKFFFQIPARIPQSQPVLLKLKSHSHFSIVFFFHESPSQCILKKEGCSFRNIGKNISIYCIISLATFRLLFNLQLIRSSTARGSGTSILSRYRGPCKY